jgi:hypothetical protein
MLAQTAMLQALNHGKSRGRIASLSVLPVGIGPGTRKTVCSPNLMVLGVISST